MNWDQQIGQILVMNKSAVSVLLFALFHSRNANKMVNIVLEQSLARIKNHIFLIAQSWDVKLKLMPYLSWFSAQFWKRSKFLLFVSAYYYQHIINIFLVFLWLSSSVHSSVYSVLYQGCVVICLVLSISTVESFYHRFLLSRETRLCQAPCR